MNRVFIYDTTLRDGAQGEGISFTVADKLEIVQLLDDLGVDYIEGGWPGSNAKDLEFFYKLKSVPLKNSRVVAFTSTRRKGQRIEEDAHMQMVLGTELKHCAVVGKTWDFHVDAALRTTLDENLSMISDTIGFLKARGIEALFDAEHFFDGYQHNPEYALKALSAARDAGADWLVLCDTNGGMLPHEIARIVSEVRAAGFGPLSIHTHNDGALAVANSLAAVQAGATQVQGTINGLGERCGNTDLCGLVPNLLLKLKMDCGIELARLPHLKSVSERLYAITGKDPQNSQAFVGNSAFAHKAGIHVSAVLRNPSLYEHVDPESVGNVRRVLVSELSGASNVVYRLEQLNLPTAQDVVSRILHRVKEAEQQGCVYEGAGTSLELLMKEESGLELPKFDNVTVSLEDLGDGFAVSLSWLEDNQFLRAKQGLGVTQGQALCHATGIFDAGFMLTDEQWVCLSRPGMSPLYRAHIKGSYEDKKVSTVGLGSSVADAMAAAVLQVWQYILHLSLAPHSRAAKSM